MIISINQVTIESRRRVHTSRRRHFSSSQKMCTLTIPVWSESLCPLVPSSRVPDSVWQIRCAPHLMCVLLIREISLAACVNSKIESHGLLMTSSTKRALPIISCDKLYSNLKPQSQKIMDFFWIWHNYFLYFKIPHMTVLIWFWFDNCILIYSLCGDFTYSLPSKPILVLSAPRSS